MDKMKGNCIKYIRSITIDDVKRKFPISIWLPRYNIGNLQGDITAGLAVGLMVAPQSLAMAFIVGLSPEYGLYSSFPGVFVYALLGSAKDVTGGPTVMAALMTKRYISFASTPSVASALAFLSGIVLLLLGIFKLGFVVRFISTPVISAFASAAAIIIAVGQLKDIFGLTNAPRPFFERFAHFFQNIQNTVPGDAVMGLACLVFLIGFQIIGKYEWKDDTAPSKWKAIGRKILWTIAISRSALVAIISTLISYLFHINGKGTIFTLPGNLPKGLPRMKSPLETVNIPGNRTLDFKDMFSEFGGGLVMVPLIMFIESISVAKTLARINQYKIDPSQELIALGIGNIFGSFFTGFPVTGSIARSPVNSLSGAVTPFSSIITGCVALLATAFITPVFQYTPKAALGSMVFAAVLTMIEVKMPQNLWQFNRLDLLPFAVSFLGCFYEVEVGILAGTGVAIMIILNRELNPRMEVIKEDDGAAVVLKLNGGVWFPGAENVTEKLLSLIQDSSQCPSIIQIDCRSMYEIDYTMALALQQVVMELQSKDKATVTFTNIEGKHVKAVLRKFGLIPGLEDAGSDDENLKLCDENELSQMVCADTAV